SFLPSKRNKSTSASSSESSIAFSMLLCNSYFGSITPGVSEKTTWNSFVLRMPLMRWRVVCALGVMMEIFSPMRAFNSVDLPALGFPMMVTNPDLNGIGQIFLADSADQADKDLKRVT